MVFSCCGGFSEGLGGWFCGVAVVGLVVVGWRALCLL